MNKLLLIGIKDLKLMFRDRAALTFMLLAPFLLTIGMGFVTGRFSGGSTGLSDIPVVIVNLDNQDLGKALEDMFNSEELWPTYWIPPPHPIPKQPVNQLDDNQASAAIIIPEGFTQSIIPTDGTMFDPDFEQPKTVKIEVIRKSIQPNKRRCCQSHCGRIHFAGSKKGAQAA